MSGEENKEETQVETKKEEVKTEEKVDNAEKPVKKPVSVTRPKPTVHKADYEKDIVYLYQFTRSPVIPSVSPFCLKVEAWIRMAGIKYENVDHKMKFRSKKGQLPFLELNGEEINGSDVMIRELSKKFSKDLDAELTSEQKNIAHAMTVMVENHLHWVNMWWRTTYPGRMRRGYKLNLQQLLGTKVPQGLLNTAFQLKFKSLKKEVKAHGLGVNTPEEIQEYGQQDCQVLSDMLGDKPYFFGDDPTTLDVTVFSQIAELLFVDKEVEYGLRDWIQENCANLVGHVNRIKERYFTDWDEMCENLDLNSHLPKPPPKEEEKKEEKKEEDKEKDTTEKETEKADADEKDKEDEKKEEDNKEAEEKEEK